MTTLRVFISYSMADRSVAREVARDLQEHGMVVWVAELAAPTGERIEDVIRKQLDAADVFVLLISPDSQHSHWARYEMSEVLKRSWGDPKRLVVPVLIGNAELPGYLRDHQFYRVQPPGSPEIFKELASDLSTLQAARGVHRTAAGDERLERRLEELERAAAMIAEAEGDA